MFFPSQSYDSIENIKANILLAFEPPHIRSVRMQRVHLIENWESRAQTHTVRCTSFSTNPCYLEWEQIAPSSDIERYSRYNIQYIYKYSIGYRRRGIRRGHSALGFSPPRRVALSRNSRFLFRGLSYGINSCWCPTAYSFVGKTRASIHVFLLTSDQFIIFWFAGSIE